MSYLYQKYVVILPIATCFIYNLYGFYAFSGTNLLTRCHSASSLFSAVVCFRKAVKEILSELGETKANIPIFPGSIQNTEEDTEEGHEVASPGGGATPLLAAPPRGVGPSGPHLLRPFAYKDPPTGKP